MPIIKFTAYVDGESVDDIVNRATAEAQEFFKDLPGKYRVKDISVSFDPESHRLSIEQAIKAAEKKLADLPEEEREGVEVIPAQVPKYGGWVEFEYDTNQKPKQKDFAEALADAGAPPNQPYQGNAAEDPRFQTPFEEA